jgi:hypothetical protein
MYTVKILQSYIFSIGPEMYVKFDPDALVPQILRSPYLLIERV